MVNIPKLSHTIDRFNQGCSFFRRAIDAWKEGNLPEYETSLRKAATEAIGALEWTLKVYLRHICRDRMTSEDKPKLKQPNFDDLITLMQSYADPPLRVTDANLLYDYRNLFRNAAEHDASVPPSEELHHAIQKVRYVILTYLPVQEDQLSITSTPITPDGVIQDLKTEYFDTLRSYYEYMDLGGISPRVGSKVVKIRMEDLFIPLLAMEEEPLYESLTEELLEDLPPIAEEEPEEPNGVPEAESLSPEEAIQMHYGPTGSRSIEITQLLEKPRVVVLGHPGSGKTTVGKYIAYSIATGKLDLVGKHLGHYIPVIVKAAEYASSLKTDPSLSFYDYIVQKHTDRFGRLFKWALQNGLCLVMIDGLDEIPETQLRITTSRRIEIFVSEFRANRFLVTSRIVGYRHNQLTGDFTHVTLSELDEDRVLRFLEQWYKAIESETELPVDESEIKRKASELWEAIGSNPGISKLAGNPLLLTIIALANWRGTKLPNRRVELYQIATETLIENWPLKQRGVALDSEEILAILEPIAYQIFSSGKNNLITEYELRPLFESQVCEVRGIPQSEARTLSREILQTIEVDTGFFLAKGFDQHGQTMYGFLHLTFAEYLTARFLAEQWSSNQLDLAQYAHDARWHEALLLMAGHIGTWAIAQATRLVNDILRLNSLYEEHLRRDLLLAAEILGDNVRVKRELQDEIVSRLIFLALSTPHMPLWVSVVNHLSDIATLFQLGKPALQFMLQDRDDIEIRVRKAMLLAMTGVDTDEVLSILLQGLSGTEEIRILVDPFLHSLGIFANEDDATHILAIQTATSGHFRRVSEQTASRIVGLQLPLCNVCTLLDKQVPTAGEACQLWLLSSAEILELGAAKVASFLTTGDWPTRVLLSITLQLRESYIPICSKLIEQAASEEPVDARLTALDAIGHLLSVHFYRRSQPEHGIVSEWAETIQVLATSDSDPVIRSKALRVLSGLPSDRRDLPEVVCQVLNDSEETVRSAAAIMASQYGPQIPEPVLQKLRALLRDASSDVRQTSSHALIGAGKFTTEEEITSLLEEGFGEPADLAEVSELDTQLTDLLLLANRARLPETLDAIGTRIKSIIETKTIKDRERAMFYPYPFLGGRRIRPRKELAEAVSMLFDNSDPVIRCRAISVWSYVRSRSIPFDRFAQLLKDDDPNVRSATIRALRSNDLEQSEIRDVLLHSLMDESPSVASSTASVLSGIREPEVRQQVIDRVASLVAQAPKNRHTYEVLWNLMASPTTRWFDIPF